MFPSSYLSDFAAMAMPVMLYVPNLIGYARIACMVASFYYARSHFLLAVTLYVLNFAGDAVDGFFARLLNQSSSFGAVLDMVTDRVSTAGLCAVLSTLYPEENFIFTMLIVIDIASHWFHVISSKGHHKSERGNWILNLYYGCYPFFGYCCLSQEFYYLARWALFFYPDMEIPIPMDGIRVTLKQVTNYVFLPGCVAKQIVNAAQWWNAAGVLAAADKQAAFEKAK